MKELVDKLSEKHSLSESEYAALIRGRALLDKGERGFRVLPAFHKPTGNEIHIGDAHQEDERAGALGERLKIEGEIAMDSIAFGSRITVTLERSDRVHF